MVVVLFDVLLGEVDDGDIGEFVVVVVVVVFDVVDFVFLIIDELIKVVEDLVGFIELLLRLDVVVCILLELIFDVFERLIGIEFGFEIELMIEEIDDGMEEVLELLLVEIFVDVEFVFDVGLLEEVEGFLFEGLVEYLDNVLVKVLDDIELVIEIGVDDLGGSDFVIEKELREGVIFGEDDVLVDVFEFVVNVGVFFVDVEDMFEVVDVIG